MRLIVALSFCVTLTCRAFEITSYLQPIPESNPVRRIQITDGRTQFSFVAPIGWSVGSDAAEKRITLSGPEPQAIISLRLLREKAPADFAQLKQMATNQLDQVVVEREFSQPVAGASAIAVDFQHVLHSSFIIATRVCVLPVPDGFVELKFSTRAGRMEQLHTGWTWLMNSLQLEQPAAPRQ